MLNYRVYQAGSNTLTLFSINDQNPVDISIIGQPQSTEGEFPISVAFNKNGTQACVLNGGTVNNVKYVRFCSRFVHWPDP